MNGRNGGGVGSTEVSSVSSKVLKVYLGKLIQLLKVHVSYVDKVRFSEDLYFPCYRVRLRSFLNSVNN